MEKTEIFGRQFSQTVLLIPFLCGEKVKSKVRSALVFFVRKSGDTLDFTKRNIVS